jgi:hypothetical protein
VTPSPHDLATTTTRDKKLGKKRQLDDSPFAAVFPFEFGRNREIACISMILKKS